MQIWLKASCVWLALIEPPNEPVAVTSLSGPWQYSPPYVGEQLQNGVLPRPFT